MTGHTSTGSDVASYDFSGLWRYTAIGSEAGNINITKESTGGAVTFSTGDTSNWGSWDTINFDTQRLYFQDSDGPYNIELDPYYSGTSGNDGYFELYRLTNSSSVLGYLSNKITLSAGTYIVGFNDNGVPANGDTDFDDIIVAMQKVNPVPEPATMLLLGSGLIGLAGFGRKRLLRKS